MEKNKLQCSLSNLTMSSEPNKMIIVGCITKIGEPSDGAPCGADGMQVVFTKKAAKDCYETFIGSPVNTQYGDWYSSEMFTEHTDKNVGFIRDAYIQGKDLMAEIVIWKDRDPSMANMIVQAMDSLGFSVEWYPTQTHEENGIVYMDAFEGCGCALLFKQSAAFQSTYIESLAASKESNKLEENNRSDTMNEEQKKEFAQEIADIVMASVEKNINELKEQVEAIKAEQVQEVEADEVDLDATIKASVEEAMKELKAQVETLKAEAEKKDIPVPQAVPNVAPNPLVASAEDDKAKKIAEIKASNMSPSEKVKQITKIRFGK